jgi:hypothetical protein
MHGQHFQIERGTVSSQARILFHQVQHRAALERALPRGRVSTPALRLGRPAPPASGFESSGSACSAAIASHSACGSPAPAAPHNPSGRGARCTGPSMRGTAHAARPSFASFTRAHRAQSRNRVITRSTSASAVDAAPRTDDHRAGKTDALGQRRPRCGGSSGPSFLAF